MTINFKNRLVAHRGDRTGGAENTLAGFVFAAKAGAHFAECDIQFTRDMIPVVIHDDSLKRLCSLEFRVSELDLIDLKELCHPFFKLLTLNQLLAWLKQEPQVTLFIEIKPDIRKHLSDHAIASLLSEYIPEMLLPRIILISESGHILDACKMQINAMAGWVAEGDDKPLSEPDYVFMPYNQADFIKDWHLKHVKVGLYTVNDVVLANQMLDKGADLIETDHFTSLSTALEKAHANH